MADDYVRTRVTRLKVSGYRSLYDVELTDLPDIVVFHGKNGTGKSNLMAVPGMVLRWAGLATGARLGLTYSDKRYGLRPTDFSRGRLPHMEIELDIVLGSAAGLIVNRTTESLGHLKIKVRAEDNGAGIVLTFEQLTLNGSHLQNKNAFKPGFVDRLRTALANQAVLLHRPAYRSIVREPSEPGEHQDVEAHASSFQRRMFAVHVDPDISNRRQLKRLGRRLAELGILPGEDQIELSPSLDKQFGEYRLFISVPNVGDIPLENLGSGQQQLLMMAADALLERRPVVQLEEPEAHLHADLMETFARFLRTEAEAANPESPIDQVWISTHHHAFAIAPEYFEVTHTPAEGTKIERRDRAYAVDHFYEPGPLWEALRSFANSTSRETVVMHDGSGQPITAGEILDSIDGDRLRANEFATAATRTIVSRFRKDPIKTP